MNDAPDKVLIVDDDAQIREALAESLDKVGFSVVALDSAAAARAYLAENQPDLVILDVMMPGEDGLSLCRWLRETLDLPVILVTALGDETDKIVGLEIGADDYVPKPFNVRELVARIKAVLRRSRSNGAGKRVSALRFGRWRLDPAQSELHRDDGLVVPLSSGELSLLRVLLDHPLETLSRDALMAKTRGREALPFERSIDNMISRLRRKIEADPSNPRHIKTVWGGGYRFAPDTSAAPPASGTSE
ncbi:MAG: response regulator [Neomegalonema sp.]|nr:response regulator [Neomegalonema sp.]